MNAMEAGPELDRLVAERVMGWTIYHYDKGYPGDEYWSLIDADGNAIIYSDRPGRYTAEFHSEEAAFSWFKPSENIAHAWQVVEWMRWRHHLALEICPGCEQPRGWIASWIDLGNDAEDDYEMFCVANRQVSKSAPTVPLAICRAALAAKGEE